MLWTTHLNEYNPIEYAGVITFQYFTKGGVTKAISSGRLLSHFFRFIKTIITC